MRTSKTNIALVITVIAYSYLFYRQSAGINFLLFNLVLIGTLCWDEPLILQSTHWRWLALGSLLSSACVGWHGADLAITAHVVSLFGLIGYRLQPDGSFLVAGLQALYSTVSAPVGGLYRLFGRPSEVHNPAQIPVHRLRTYAWPTLITLVFFLLY